MEVLLLRFPPPLPADLWPHLSGHWDLVAQWSSSASGPLHPGSHTSSLFPPRPTLQAGSTTMLGFKPKSRHDWAATLSFAKGYKTLKRHLEAEREASTPVAVPPRTVGTGQCCRGHSVLWVVSLLEDEHIASILFSEGDLVSPASSRAGDCRQVVCSWAGSL